MKKNQVKNKIIVLGDTHGRNKWEEIVKQPFSKVIFLGDYFDSFDIPFKEQMDNFVKILTFKKDNPLKVILLLGNHDYHYLSSIEEHYSGFQYGKLEITAVLETALEDGLIQVCHLFEDWIFTHAGVTNTWAINNNIDVNNIDKSINDLFIKNRSAFGFTDGINHSNCGDDITQSPLWVRPRSLGEDKIPEFKQVVGHTHQEHIQNYDEMYFIDTLEYGNEYLIINNGKPEIGEI